MTTLRAVVSIAGQPEFEVCDAAGRVLARRATWRQAEAWARRYEAAGQPRADDDRPASLDEIARELERRSHENALQNRVNSY